jgi:hypothetical protein
MQQQTTLKAYKGEPLYVCSILNIYLVNAVDVPAPLNTECSISVNAVLRYSWTFAVRDV